MVVCPVLNLVCFLIPYHESQLYSAMKPEPDIELRKVALHQLQCDWLKIIKKLLEPLKSAYDVWLRNKYGNSNWEIAFQRVTTAMICTRKATRRGNAGIVNIAGFTLRTYTSATKCTAMEVYGLVLTIQEFLCAPRSQPTDVKVFRTPKLMGGWLASQPNGNGGIGCELLTAAVIAIGQYLR